jgi:hypothetical protein
MLNDILGKILSKLEQSGLQVKNIDFNAVINKQGFTLSKPCVSLNIQSATFKNGIKTDVVCSPIISMLIVTQHISSEKSRKSLMYDVIEAIVQELTNEKLGLSLQNEIKPTGFADITPPDFAAKGCLIYELKLTCSFNYEKIPEDQQVTGVLEKIINKYYVNNPDDDGEIDLQSEIDFVDIDGGIPHTDDFMFDIDGGNAGTKLIEGDVDGGNPGSVFYD